MQRVEQNIFLVLMACVCALGIPGIAAGLTSISSKESMVSIQNDLVQVDVDLEEGVYRIHDRFNHTDVIQKATFFLDRGFSAAQYAKRVPETYLSTYRYKTGDLNDLLGHGKRLTLYRDESHKYRPTQILIIDLYDDSAGVVLGFGVENAFAYPIRIKEAIVCEGLIPVSSKMRQAFTLNGEAGAGRTAVKSGANLSCLNMGFLTFDTESGPRSITAGGLATYEFIKNVSYQKTDQGIMFVLSATDPVGRRVDPGQTHIFADRFYLDCVTRDAFVSLETYARKVKAVHQASPKVYDFPTICGWATQNKGLGSGIPVNNSAGMVEELDHVQKSGFLNYSPVAVRIEPDTYCYGNHGYTQQGWYDDDHWSERGHTLRDPYPTFAQFCRAVEQRGCIPFTYFQVGMPANDFAAAHPDWMLNNDISMLHQYHGHHMPLVSYDITDEGFGSYMLAMWKRLRKDGIKGIKFDYPETGWHPQGGFENPYATAVSAYRRYYELAREGLGPDAYLHERLLGATGTPLMEATLGLVDLQRVTGDGSHFTPEMISKIGLRWYKNRVLYNYYPDSKAIAKPDKPLSVKDRRTLLTGLFMVSARLELASSFRHFTPEIQHDLERVYPVIPANTLVRPVDMFVHTDCPRLYALDVNQDWIQLMVFNPLKREDAIEVSLSGDRITEGALALDRNASYYIYDFWNNRLTATVSGHKTFTSQLAAHEALMYSIRKVQSHPQVLSTNRHVLQGVLDMSDVLWDNATKTLSAVSAVVGGEPYRIIIAANGYQPHQITAKGVALKHLDREGPDLYELTLQQNDTQDFPWKVQFLASRESE